MYKQRNAGFTLIEFIITIAVMMVLLLQGVPLTMQWVGSSNIRSGTTLFNQGVARAKSRALRNGSAVTASNPAAYLVLNNNTVCAQDAATASGLNCTNAVWTGKLPNATTAILNGAAAQCVAYNDSGLPVAATLGSTQCGTAATFIVTSMGVSSDTTAVLN
ncbi:MULTISPECIES: pilus assembly FimT family protein [Silvimonas]|uniref:pilus assembly FimT family protein n=1 Tax=Silvimonas TaxID=300264 RepID=UPI0024B3222E|nr:MULTISPECIES: prepilin-type N-terminal cleavage/methylation domain-containing protein [Silvimonas]MDR3426275.1 prepilin-type N-terminal cleavage/methylation domain-containing protein [Silvimonas sp.]